MSINVSPHEPAADSSSESPLRLTSVVAVSRELYAAHPPDRYTVSVAFSRRVLPAEARLIQGPETHDRLREQGYGHVSLVINEARLDIVNTSLEELKARLAPAIGALIRNISDQTRRERELRDEAALSKRRADEALRQEIETLARSISFD
jgi:hypothetical protein